MSRTSWCISGCLQQLSRCLQWNPGVSLDVVNVDICLAKALATLQVSPVESRRYHCCEACGMSLDISSRSPGVSSRIQEVSLDVANMGMCLAKAPVSLQVSPAESRRYHWMSRTLWSVAGCLQEVSRCLQQNPGGIIGCREPCGVSLDVSSRSPGVSSRIQGVSFDVVNVAICLGLTSEKWVPDS